VNANIVALPQVEQRTAMRSNRPWQFVRPLRLMGTIPERPAPPHLSLDLWKLGEDLLGQFLLSAWHFLASIVLLHTQILFLDVAPFEGRQVSTT